MDPYTGLPKMPTFTQNVPTQAPGAMGGQMPPPVRPPVRRPQRSGQPPTGPVRRRAGGKKRTGGPPGGPVGQSQRLPPEAQAPGWPMEGADVGLDWALGRRLGNGGYSR